MEISLHFEKRCDCLPFCTYLSGLQAWGILYETAEFYCYALYRTLTNSRASNHIQLGTIATFIVERRTQKTNEVLWKHELTIDDLRSMSSSDGTVTEMDFLIFMLKAMKKVDDDLVSQLW